MVYTGEHFGIRAWQTGDEAYLALHANNFNIWKNLKDIFPHPYTYDDAVFWIENQIKNTQQFNFAIVIDDEPMGSIGFILGNDVHKKSIELGYWISEEYWGQGIATEAVSIIKEYIFTNYNINRLFATVFSNNKASASVLLKNGFMQEAMLKRAVYKNNEVLDELIFAIVRP